jgi:MSHA pilin protein MshA
MRKTQKQQGFTIIELVVVIVILGILAAVAFPKFQDLSGDARKAVLQGAQAAVQSAAVITFAKTQGATSSAPSIISNTSLDSAISVSGTPTCSSITLAHSGGGTLNFALSTDYCSP